MLEWIRFFEKLAPLFALMLGGWFVRHALLKDEALEQRLIVLTADFFLPPLILVSLATSPIGLGEMAALAGAGTLVFFGLLAASALYALLARVELRRFSFPVIFINTGFMGIPLMLLMSGRDAMNYMLLYDQVQGVLMFTIGIVMATGSFRLKGLREIILSPIWWALWAGLALKLSGLALPAFLVDSLYYAGNVAPPLAIFSLGFSFKGTRLDGLGHLAAGFLLRWAGGLVLGVLAAKLFGLTGDAALAMIVGSALPSAVFSYVLSVRYGLDGSFARSMVALSTVLSVVSVPLAFTVARLFGS